MSQQTPATGKTPNGILQCLHIGEPEARSRSIATAKLLVQYFGRHSLKTQASPRSSAAT
jgi:hypothetical protein